MPLTRRLLPFALPGLAAAAGPAPQSDPAHPGKNCGDPGGRFIACEALQAGLPPSPFPRCPLCGGRHAVAPPAGGTFPSP